MPEDKKVPEGPTVKEQLAALNKQEAKTIPGAPLAMPKEMLLELTPEAAADKENHYRFINVKSADNALRRQSQGYEIVPEGEGGKRLGAEMALARTPVANYEARKKSFEKLGKQRLEAHKTEVQAVVQSVVRELRDKHGISVDERRIFVDE